MFLVHAFVCVRLRFVSALRSVRKYMYYIHVGTYIIARNVSIIPVLLRISSVQAGGLGGRACRREPAAREMYARFDVRVTLYVVVQYTASTEPRAYIYTASMMCRMRTARVHGTATRTRLLISCVLEHLCDAHKHMHMYTHNTDACSLPCTLLTVSLGLLLGWLLLLVRNCACLPV